ILKTYHAIAGGEPCALGQGRAGRFLVKETEEVWERGHYTHNNRYHCTLFGDNDCWRDFPHGEIVQPVKFVEAEAVLYWRTDAENAPKDGSLILTLWDNEFTMGVQ